MFTQLKIVFRWVVAVVISLVNLILAYILNEGAGVLYMAVYLIIPLAFLLQSEKSHPQAKNRMFARRSPYRHTPVTFFHVVGWITLCLPVTLIGVAALSGTLANLFAPK